MSGGLPRVFKPALVIALVEGLAIVVYLAVERHRGTSREQPFRYEHLAVGRRAPDLELASPDGSVRRLSELRGKTVLLHFWATWCPPCREELPGLLELGRELSRDGIVEVVAVTLDDDWAAVRGFFGGDIPREVVQDESSSSTRIYDVSALPDTYLVAPDGALIIRFGGARDWRDDRARELLKRYGRPR